MYLLRGRDLFMCLFRLFEILGVFESHWVPHVFSQAIASTGARQDCLQRLEARQRTDNEESTVSSGDLAEVLSVLVRHYESHTTDAARRPGRRGGPLA